MSFSFESLNSFHFQQLFLIFPVQTLNITPNSYHSCFSEIYCARYLTKIVPVSAEMQVCMAGLGSQQWPLMPNTRPLYLYCCRHNRCMFNLFWKSFLFSINLFNASKTFSNYETSQFRKSPLLNIQNYKIRASLQYCYHLFISHLD